MIFSEELKKRSKGISKELAHIGLVLQKVSAGQRTFPSKDLKVIMLLEKRGFVKPRRRKRTKTGHLVYTGYSLTEKGRIAVKQFL